MDDHFGLLRQILGLLDEPTGLFANPGRIRVLRRFRHDGLSCFQAQEHHHIQVPNALGRYGLHGEEIASPERGSMPVQEVRPRVGCAIWARFDVMFLQDRPYRLTADLDAEFAQLAHDASQSKARLLDNGENKRTNLLWLTLSAFGIFRFWLAVLFFSHPPIERGWADDGDQFLDGSTDGLAVFQQYAAFFGRRVNLLWQARAENLVLVFQLFDLFGKFTVGRRGDQGKKWVENARHRGIFVWGHYGMGYTFIKPCWNADAGAVFAPITESKRTPSPPIITNRFFEVIYGWQHGPSRPNAI